MTCMTLHGKGKAFRGGILFHHIFYHLPCRTIYNDGIWDLESRKHYVVVQLLSHIWLFTTPWNAVHQAPLSSSISRVCSNSRPLSWWCCLTILSSAIPFSICFQSFPTCGLFQRVGSFTLSGQSTGASASVFPMFQCCTQYVSKFGKLSSDHRTGKSQFSIQSLRRLMPKNVQTTVQLCSFHMLARLCSKSFKLVLKDAIILIFCMLSF